MSKESQTEPTQNSRGSLAGFPTKRKCCCLSNIYWNMVRNSLFIPGILSRKLLYFGQKASNARADQDANP
jgi:hypothetical protein